MVNQTKTTALRNIYELEASKLLGEMSRILSLLEKQPHTRTVYTSNLYTLYRCAHTLKSMSADMGLTHVHKLSKALELMFKKVRSQGKMLTVDQLRKIRVMLKQCASQS